MRRRTFIAASLGAAAGAAGHGAAGAPRIDAALHTGAALAFGTTVNVAVRHRDARLARAAIADALAALQGVDRLMSIYSPDSEVFRLNRDGFLARPDPRLLVVLGHARALSALTQGAFDITVQPLWQLFNAAADGLPPPHARGLAGARVGWRRVEADRARVLFGKPGMAITLNGLAQGYAADLALAALRARGIDHALVNTGEFAALGAPRATRPWLLGVADPREAGALAATVALDGRSMATSGDYASSFTPDFSHHHIFDPATSESPREMASVTVLAPTGIEADGLSTAFVVMGARRAHALAAHLPGVDLMTINKRGEVWKSPAFAAKAA
ncbi:FAD:protein FMN transferase [Massilia glaciei]|uniref:FAD:protein FMN transferase n=2 Tax=Massilia glaciei TaxID=1524097 RepID=A0A2U2I7A3_9BURK|nr:FAD:protein FMN transferase [Massilia glaciei]